ncbi:MAG: hypothetical protein ABSA97_05975 [Verrucomicrobiia bacterium]
MTDNQTAQDHYGQIKGELTDFGSNAVADVGKIMTLVQALGLPEKDVMPIRQHVCGGICKTARPEKR